MEKISCFSSDIKNLLTLFRQEENDHSYARFKSIWSQMGFSTIHETKPEYLSVSDYQQLLFSTTLGYFYVNHNSPIIRLGALFCLYTLYQTQQSPVKCKIIVSVGLWQELNSFFRNWVIVQRNADAYQMFQKMKREEFFSYTVLPSAYTSNLFTSIPNQVKPSPDSVSSLPETPVNMDTVTNVVDTETLQSITGDYLAIKQQLEMGDGSKSDLGSLKFVLPDFANEIASILQQHNNHRIASTAVTPQSMGLPVSASSGSVSANAPKSVVNSLFNNNFNQEDGQ